MPRSATPCTTGRARCACPSSTSTAHTTCASTPACRRRRSAARGSRRSRRRPTRRTCPTCTTWSSRAGTAPTPSRRPTRSSSATCAATTSPGRATEAARPPGEVVAPPRYGVLGWPVAHSLSPQMHAAAFAALGLEGWRYQRLPVPPELFAETVRALGGAGFAGANVTVPHKEAALAVADEATAAARAIGAANTLSFGAGGAIAADNTDAPGLLAALPVAVAGRTALVLGAGGSARAAVYALREAGAQQVAVFNRTPERAQALAADLGARVAPEPEPAELLVNCTSVGLEDPDALPLPATALGAYGAVVDLVYRPGGTRLVREARERGLPCADGLEVLVQQGARSLEIWTGRAAPVEAMRAAIVASTAGSEEA